MRVVPLCLVLLLPSLAQAKSFGDKQRAYPRVRAALAEKRASVAAMFAKQGLEFPPREVFIRIFKDEGEVELWARDKRSAAFTKVKTFPVCYASGALGPKRRQGDEQVPEGFYVIDRYNAWSNFHLSLGIDYPNRSDRILGHKRALGGDIFIHGSCVSIGCVAITDDLIKELYVVAMEARARGQRRVPVHIFPLRMSAANMPRLEKAAGTDAARLRFWRNLQAGYDAFEAKKIVPKVSVDARGAYRFR